MTIRRASETRKIGELYATFMDEKPSRKAGLSADPISG